MKIKVDQKLMEHLEKLSKLKIPENLRPKLLNDMQRILEYMELLDEVDVSNVEETYTTVESTNILRKDEVREFEDKDLIKNNFPEKEGNYIKVPSIHGVKKEG
ncbi:MAG: aspartyl-tRNA(Asn)/glutamyl-tRNA(Gln) amidotransferase subunit [Thermotogaceae bacterium]|nr:aspartyl-tRNA(Asn)/glutamyl-tRNA(Gln) amidotransferase subunit [Thermotogaceae bacterium]MDN5338483.1 aspartyl-tRNA(Asn)/glutamyl-tRNA(Gln) amidotransferase subunit [Thermotogaceae bacterium]